ncbi:MAG: hypothetical protein ABIM77_04765 [candidate division WOR-3 bacterium]
MKWVYIIIIIGNFYENNFKFKFFQKEYEIMQSASNFAYSYQNNEVISNKSRWKDFGIYTLEFIASSPLPALEALLYMVSLSLGEGDMCSNEKHTLSEELREVIILGSINSVVISGTCELIGRLTKKRGNFLHSAIGTFIGSSITCCGMMGYSFYRKYEISDILILSFAALIGTVPQLCGVIGYNLKCHK